MSIDNNTYKEDMEYICAVSYIPWEQLQGKNILVTGATGLIGFTIINALMYANKERKLGLKVLAMVRSLEKARQRFLNVIQDEETLVFLIGEIEKIPEIKDPIDYIIHGASQTASKAFVQQPVETICTAVYGTRNVLELAKSKSVQGMIYLSSMEIYGYPEKGHRIKEDEKGVMAPLNIRNSYPISKQVCENLCCAYVSEYQIPIKIIRLTQTFGPGVNYNDGRIFAEFGRCIWEKKDIVLKTKGETERSYLYTADAVTAILTVLLKGISGTAYNAAAESTYCSIAEMAEEAADIGGINVRIELNNEQKSVFLDTLYMDLDTEKLRELGWRPEKITLRAMYYGMLSMWEKIYDSYGTIFNEKSVP